MNKDILQDLAEFGPSPLTVDVSKLSKDEARRYLHTLESIYYLFQSRKGLEGDYSFLHVTGGAKNGTYCVVAKDGFGTGEIIVPNKQCNEWQYSFNCKGQNASGTAPSFDMAKKSIFDFIYSLVSPAEYLKLMGI